MEEFKPGGANDPSGTATTQSGTPVDPKPQAALPQAPPASAPSPFPDGGTEAWLTVFGSFLAMFCSFGQLNSFGTFQEFYGENQLQNLSPSTIAWIGSLQLWVFFFSGGFIGRFFDAYGPRPILIIGSLVLVFGTMMTSISNRYYQFILAQGIVIGVGVGAIFYPTLSAISTYFLKHRSIATGIALSGSGIGGVAWPIIYQRLFPRIGFGWTVRATGFITMALCAVAIFTVSSNIKAKRKSMGWLETRFFRDSTFMLVVMAGILTCLGFYIPFFYIVDYATAHGISPQTAFYVLSVMNAGGVLGRFVPPLLSDMFGCYNVMFPSVFLMGLLTLVFWPFATTVASIMLFAAIYGFFAGAFNALIIPCVAAISDIREIGTRVGILFSIVSFPTLAGGPAAGATIHGTGRAQFLRAILLSGFTMVAGSFFYGMVGLRVARKKAAQRSGA